MKTEVIIVSSVLSFVILACESCSVLQTTNELLIDDINAQQLGILEEHKYKCSVEGPSIRTMYVYLPSTYYESTDHYPVLYILHGAHGNETSWIQKGRILEIIDSLSVVDEIDECIYVFPNMNHYFNDYDYGNSRELGSIDSYLGLDGSVEYGFINDVVAYIDSHFRTIPDKNHRAIVGLSLGGLQAIYISSCYWDAFGDVGLFSPLLNPPFKLGKYTKIYNHIEEKLYKQFELTPNYWIMVGKDDPYFNSSYCYSRLLRRNKHPHKLYISGGGHKWENWRKYAVIFIKELWRDDSLHNTTIILEN